MAKWAPGVTAVLLVCSLQGVSAQQEERQAAEPRGWERVKAFASTIGRSSGDLTGTASRTSIVEYSASFGESVPYARFGWGATAFEYFDVRHLSGDPEVHSLLPLYLYYTPYARFTVLTTQPVASRTETADSVIYRYYPSLDEDVEIMDSFAYVFVGGSAWAVNASDRDEDDDAAWGPVKFGSQKYLNVGVGFDKLITLDRKPMLNMDVATIGVQAGVLLCDDLDDDWVSMPYIGISLGFAAPMTRR